jgi:hypothetical protein
MIHHAHPVTSGAACIASDNTRTNKDIRITGLTYVREVVTCPNCLVDVDDTGNTTERAARAQNAMAYNPLDFPHVAEPSSEIFTNPAMTYTVVLLPVKATGDATKRDTPYQSGFAMDRYAHCTTACAIAYAESRTPDDGFSVIYPLVEFPRHLPGYRPIAYYGHSTWFKVLGESK